MLGAPQSDGVREADCTDLGMNELQPFLAANSLAPRGPPMRPSVSACYRCSHRRPYRDRRAENTCSDVEHVPVIGPLSNSGSIESGSLMSGVDFTCRTPCG
jgi:hypothetical protein